MLERFLSIKQVIIESMLPAFTSGGALNWFIQESNLSSNKEEKNP